MNEVESGNPPVPETLKFQFMRQHKLIATLAVLLIAAAGWFVWSLGEEPAVASGSQVYIVADWNAPVTSSPSSHSPSNSANNPQFGGKGDWAGDWGVAAGTPISPHLQGPYGTTYRVVEVFPVCPGGAGGTGVKVEVSEPNGGPAIGWVAYLHLSDVRVAPGDTVYDDTVLGVVGDGFTPNDSCWSAPHLHLEARNYAQGDLACYYDADASPGSRLGRVGGSDVTSRPAACPA